jgi:diacylglycerol kinase (ATP)
MKRAHILHNPSAGNQDQSKKDLVKLIESYGYECGYSSTKEIKWKKVQPETDFLVVAGGDGTVRKVAVDLLRKERFRKHLPILLLPMGTANNISKTLGIEGHEEELVGMLDNKRVKKYDVGIVEGLKEDWIFLESFGTGIFPELMNKMKEIPERENATPEENLKTALEVLHDTILKVKAKRVGLKINGKHYDDKYLLVEVMNSSSIGPNLLLSPDADPGDGEFEVILVPESQREEFASYVSYKINGIERSFKPQIIKGKEITITAPGGLLHADDELISTRKAKKIKIRPEWGMMEFFVQ